MSLHKARGGRMGALALLVALLPVGVLAACSKSASPGSNGAQSGSDPSGTVRIVVSSSDSTDAGFQAVNKAFMQKYPKVQVEFSTIPNDNYNQVKSSRLTAGSADIVVAFPREVPSYVPQSNQADDARLADAGGFVDLTSMAFMKNYTPTVLDSIKYKGKQFTVPTGLSYETGVYYNKAIFAKNNLSVPTTWTQFVQLCQTLKADGVTPLGIGGKDSWPAGLNMLGAVQGLYPTAQDKDNLARGLWQKNVKLTDATPERVLERTETMFTFAQPNFAGVPYSATASGFVNAQFAMTVDGTWNEPTIASAAGPDFSFGYFPLPASDNAQDNLYFGGKVELMLAIPSNSKNVGAAEAYLNFFSDPTNYQTFVKLAGFAPSQQNITLSPFLTSIGQYTKEFQPSWDFLWTPNTKAGPKATFPFNYVDLSPLGSSNATAAAQTASKDWLAGF